METSTMTHLQKHRDKYCVSTHCKLGEARCLSCIKTDEGCEAILKDFSKITMESSGVDEIVTKTVQLLTQSEKNDKEI